MMKRFPTSFGIGAALAATATLATGCAGSETGNGRKDEDMEQVWLSLSATPDVTSVEALGRDGARFVITEAEGGVRTVKVSYSGETCSVVAGWECSTTEPELSSSAGWIADLMGAAIDPTLLLPEGLETDSITGFKIQWGSSDEPALRIAGNVVVPGASEGKPFEALIDLTGTTHFAVVPEVGEAPDGQRRGWLLSLDPSAWFVRVDIAACLDAGLVPINDAGVLMLDAADRSCGNVAADIAAGFRQDGKAQRNE